MILVGEDSRIAMPITAIIYAALGIFLGFFFPGSAWEAGLGLIGLFVLLAVGYVVFVNKPPPRAWSRELPRLLETACILAGAFCGTAFGAGLQGRSQAKSKSSR